MLKPKHLKSDGSALWEAIADEYAIEDSGGQALLTVACECLDRMRAAQVAIEADGEIIEDRYGRPKQHPALALEKDARAGFLQALKALNLDVEPLRDRPGRPGVGLGITHLKGVK